MTEIKKEYRFDPKDYDGLTKDQQMLKAFMMTFTNYSPENHHVFTDESREEFKWLQEFDNGALFEAAAKGEAFRRMCSIFNHYREESNEALDIYYPDVLQKMRNLAVELGLNDSLELSNLYSYLLWNGYLSKDKKNAFSAQDRNVIFGMFFSDVMNGKSVCLNHSDMLKDFLNICGYDAASLITYVGKDVDLDYRARINRDIEDFSLAFKTLNLFMSSHSKAFGNHALTLVRDNDRLVVHDSTNLALFGVKNASSIELINGSGVCKLNPMASCVINSGTESELRAISGLYEVADFQAPYSRKDFIFTSEENVELFNDSIALLDDFYDEVKPSIMGICAVTDELKKGDKMRLLVKTKEEFKRK